MALTRLSCQASVGQLSGVVLYPVNKTYLVVQRQRALEGDVFSANTRHHAQALGPHPSSWGLCVQLELLHSL